MSFRNYYFLIIGFYIVQRVFELVLNARNEKILFSKFHAFEANHLDSIRMKVFHVSWFMALSIESFIKHQVIGFNFLLYVLIILIFCQIMRMHTVLLLKEFWTIKVYQMDDHPIIYEGAYRIIRHPNYAVVCIELFLIPFIFKAYITAILFSLGNLFILKKRIDLEESMLNKQSDYQVKFNLTKKLIPFIY